MNELAINKMELQTRIGAIVKQAYDVLVESDADVQTATEMTRAIKSMGKAIKDQYEPLRVETKAAYDAVLSERDGFVKPLTEAESVLKGKIIQYDEIKRKRADEEAERLRAMAAEEARRKAEEASTAEAEGDAIGAEMARLEADALQATAENAGIASHDAQADGMSRRRATYRLTKVDPSVVPVEIAGAVIRPVDEKAVIALIKASKGTIKIPGVEYEEVVSIVIR